MYIYCTSPEDRQTSCKVWFTSIQRLAAVTKRRRETRRNLLGCPNSPAANRSQPLVGRSSPYCESLWKRYCCLRMFSDCRYMPSLRKYSRTKLCDGAQIANFWRFLRPLFSSSRVQHISDLYCKFAPRPHLVRKYGRYSISDR